MFIIGMITGAVITLIIICAIVANRIKDAEDEMLSWRERYFEIVESKK